MPDGWRASPEPNALLMEFANLLRNPLMLTQDPTARGKLGAFSDTLSEVLFGGAPDEIQKWAEGNSPFYSERRIPELKSERKLPVVDAVSSLPIATTLKGGKVAAGGGMAALAGVVKPKGGNWLDTEVVVKQLTPKKGPYGAADQYTDEGLELFREKLEAPYKARLEKWIKTHMGTAEDPLKDERIGKTPYTWGDLGDESVYKIKPEDIAISRDREATYDSALGDYIRDDQGRRIYTEKEVVGVDTPSKTITPDHPNVIADLKKFRETGEGEFYGVNSPDNTIRSMVKQLRETPREGYIEPNPAWKEGEPRKWLPGKDVMGPLPAWKENDSYERANAVQMELANLLSNIGEYGGSYKVPKDREFNLGKDFAETIPDIVKTWPKKFETADLHNIERNKAGLVKEAIEADPGYGWYRHTTPEGVRREGKLMRHCVGNYCDEVGTGKNFYSLRDERHMTPAVTLSTNRIEPHVNIGPEHDWGDIVEALHYPQGVEPLRDPHLMGRIQALREAQRYPDIFQPNPDVNPELARWIQGVQQAENPLEAIRGGLDAEDLAELERFMKAEGPTMEPIDQIKGAANSPISPQYVESVLKFLRSKENIQPGTLAEGSESFYARILPFKGEYLSEPEARDKVVELAMGDPTKYGRYMRNLARNHNNNVQEMVAYLRSLRLNDLQRYLE